MGSDEGSPIALIEQRQFQFTLPRGERRDGLRLQVDDAGFQFTLPRGERLVIIVAKITVGVSIHAPAWGATFTCETGHAGTSVSIHAPAWGAT